ncbi:MAG: cytochrome C [Alphaproteobacteria bacterium]|nr:cytochrome C [Alphaproteobacteria bacterium]
MPSFARQTGQPCTSCHAGFPELTPYGRTFKLRGYSDSVWESNFPEQPPLAAMIQPQFTHTDTSQPAGTTPRFKTNDNVTMQTGSIFYGGKIAYTSGAFIQTTYSNGGSSDRYFLDTSDIRYANEGAVMNQDLIWGITVNNAPTFEDVWNTTPAWSYPYAASNLAPSPAVSTLLDSGNLNSRVAGLGAYTLVNDLVYVAVAAYRPLSPEFQTKTGISPFQQDRRDGVMPYWRVAVQPAWNQHAFEAGTFGFSEKRFPAGVVGSGTDQLTDVGFDGQYQYLGDVNYVSFMASWIHESQNLDATFALGNSSRTRDTLQRFKAKATYIYDNTYGATVGYFNTSGTNDPTLYANSTSGSPASAGWNFQLDYLMVKESPLGTIWPWAGGRISLMYTMYNKFNGAGRNFDGTNRAAWDNNTLFLVAWLAF